MRKVIYGLAVSLDSMIEGPNGEYDWCFTDQDYGMSEFLETIDTVFYGRRSYELMASQPENPFGRGRQYVLSTSLQEVKPGYELMRSVGEARKVIKGKGKDVWVFGGASLATLFMNEGLITHLWVSVHPILLGEGKPLFEKLTGRRKLKLLECKPYETGLVSLRYEVVRAED